MKNLRKAALGKAARAMRSAQAKHSDKAEPPASAEPVPEAPEAALWPEAGVKVAVGVEHLAHSLRLGETAVSEGPALDDAREVIVRLDSAAVLSSMRMPRSVLVPIGAPVRNMRLWDKCRASLGGGAWTLGRATSVLFARQKRGGRLGGADRVCVCVFVCVCACVCVCVWFPYHVGPFLYLFIAFAGGGLAIS